MKHLLTILSGLLVALLFARCADDDNLSGGIDGLPERGIVIRLSTGELDTRTQLTSTGDYHHVEEVWAVLYKWNGTGEASDPDNLGSYDFVSATNLMWDPYSVKDYVANNPAPPYPGDDASEEEKKDYQDKLDEYNNTISQNYGGEYGNGKVQGREFVLPESGAMTAGTYRVLCIGFDEASKTCYGLQNGSSLTLSGTLAEAYAKLSNEEFGGELFAGWTEFEFEPDNINIAEVELKRRVAGVLCYVNDIPTTITDGTETYTINTIRLCLNTKANDAIHLCRLDDRTKDFGTTKGNAFTDEDKTILAEYEIPEDIIAAHQGEVQGQGKEIFEGNLGQTFEDANVQIKDGSVLLGAYLIPIKHEEGKATLSVELLDANGTVAKTFNAVRSDDPDGELTDESGATIDSQNTTSYDILPNYIYHIGDKDDDTDEPMSLLGQKITVVPKEWEGGETIPVEFPSVPIKVTIANSDDFEGEILDCIGIETVLNIRNAVVHKDWYLTTTSEGVYFKQSDGTYDKSYYPSDGEKESSDIVPVTIVITDYAKYNDYKTTAVEDDKRPIDIQVMVGSEVQDKIEAEQWNAIIAEVYFGDNDKVDHYVGFSRYDRGPVQWGYNGDTDISILGANYNRDTKDLSGVYNYSQAESQSKEEKWLASAIYKGACDGVIYNSDTELASESFWFLPAYYELGALLNSAWNVRNDEDAYNSYYLKARNGNSDYTNCYWSSSVVEARIYYAWAGYLDLNETHRDVDDFFTADKGNSEINERTRSYYLRPCKVITR